MRNQFQIELEFSKQKKAKEMLFLSVLELHFGNVLRHNLTSYRKANNDKREKERKSYQVITLHYVI